MYNVAIWGLRVCVPRDEILSNMVLQGSLLRNLCFLGISTLTTPEHCKKSAFWRHIKENQGSVAPLFEFPKAIKSSTCCDLSRTRKIATVYLKESTTCMYIPLSLSLYIYIYIL